MDTVFFWLMLILPESKLFDVASGGFRLCLFQRFGICRIIKGNERIDVMKSLAEYRAVVISEERENESLIRPYDLQAGVENRKNTASDDTRHEKSRPRRRTAADPESADDDDDGRSDDQSCDEKEHHKSVERTYPFCVTSRRES